MLVRQYGIEVCVREHTVFPRQETGYSVPPGKLARTQRRLESRLLRTK